MSTTATMARTSAAPIQSVLRESAIATSLLAWRETRIVKLENALASGAIPRKAGGLRVKLERAREAELPGLLQRDVEEAEVLEVLGALQRADVHRAEPAVGDQL